MRQPATMHEARSMVKERWLDRRVDKLSKENDKLREAVGELRLDLDEAQGRSKETLAALSKTRRPGRIKVARAGRRRLRPRCEGRSRPIRAAQGLGAFDRPAGWERHDRQRDRGIQPGLAAPTYRNTTRKERRESRLSFSFLPLFPWLSHRSIEGAFAGSQRREPCGT